MSDEIAQSWVNNYRVLWQLFSVSSWHCQHIACFYLKKKPTILLSVSRGVGNRFICALNGIYIQHTPPLDFKTVLVIGGRQSWFFFLSLHLNDWWGYLMNGVYIHVSCGCNAVVFSLMLSLRNNSIKDKIPWFDNSFFMSINMDFKPRDM